MSEISEKERRERYLALGRIEERLEHEHALLTKQKRSAATKLDKALEEYCKPLEAMLLNTKKISGLDLEKISDMEVEEKCNRFLDLEKKISDIETEAATISNLRDEMLNEGLIMEDDANG